MIFLIISNVLLLVVLSVIFYKKLQTNKSVSFVIDKDALIDDRLISILKFIKNIQINIIVPKFIVDDFERMIESGKLDEWEIGNKAIENMRKLQEIESFNINILEIMFNENMPLNDKIIQTVKKYNSYLITANFDLYVKANIENLKLINIKYIEEISKQVILPGTVLKVYIADTQEQNGISYFTDGTKIIIDEAAQNLKTNVLCQVYKVTKETNNKIIAAKFLHAED